ncbi:endonuclease domain-containing protein [Crocosphaera sp. UHCC 0190]|uniref:endonuclease domain-containing protein n=1 Tax=Crocosphaera sp. UHCC 0190 TaxID=3110246 RepID=UPI002B21ACE2|nr:endonuclease domain-containing protein [Crocosphaera sp. UHCC 0190]MEA5508563.1 endonuclease domain-containing protein [Crocosphaera sp. UHCC 0190]
MTELYNKSCEKDKRRSLRNNMPPAEKLLWARLRGRQVEGAKFRRQYSIGGFVVDFYVPELRLAIEVDGPSHLGAEAQAYDAQRQAFIESFGTRFLRFTNQQVYQELDAVVEAIALVILDMRSLSPPFQRGD